jgi:N-acetylmuramoyl-L-alanine amidase
MDAVSMILRSPLPYLLIITLLACAPKPRPTLPRFYEGLAEPLDTLDVSSVAGRTIVIDPGHGGVFRGAVGLEGLDEADVNLGVALYLWGLLDEAGANVYLTRKADRDFVEGDTLALRRDLEARVTIANRIGPDVFMSLHHNADFAGDRTFNEIQIYHKIDDDGPSLDIARIVARHLLRNIGETKTKVLPGNYYVLRNAEVPSILCEPSYISNPHIESKLRLAEKQRLEAEVYFMALVDYFSRGIPAIDSLGPEGLVSTAMPRIEVVFDTSAVVDLGSVAVHLDDARLRVSKTGPNRFTAVPPEPLRGGPHLIKAMGRAVGGNSTAEAVATFEVDLEPHVMSLRATPEEAAPPFPQRLSALVEDEYGNAVEDGTPVEFTWEGGLRRENTVDGEASVFTGREVPFGLNDVSARSGEVSSRVDIRVSASGRYVSGFVLGAADMPLEGATVMSAGTLTPAVTDRHGFFVIDADSTPVWLRVSKPGYREQIEPVGDRAFPVVRLPRFYEALEPGLTVTLDPQGGGQETGWVGATGVTASDLNLRVAENVAALLRSAGIEVLLTRDTDREVGDAERVVVCESGRSALLVSIAHGRGDPKRLYIDHFPGSIGGTFISECIADEVRRGSGCDPVIGETAEYIVQQTSCPAVRISFTAGDESCGEADLGDAYGTWKRAYPLHLGVLRFLGVDKESAFDVSGRVTSGGKPLGGAVVTIDGSLEVPVDRHGRFTARMLEAGTHIAEAFSGSRKSEPVRFDGATGTITLEL